MQWHAPELLSAKPTGSAGRSEFSLQLERHTTRQENDNLHQRQHIFHLVRDTGSGKFSPELVGKPGGVDEHRIENHISILLNDNKFFSLT